MQSDQDLLCWYKRAKKAPSRQCQCAAWYGLLLHKGFFVHLISDTCYSGNFILVLSTIITNSSKIKCKSFIIYTCIKSQFRLYLLHLTLCMLGNFACFFFCHLWIFFLNKLFQKCLSGIPSECQTLWIQIRPDVLSGLILVQTVCKGYQQTTKVANSGERVLKVEHLRFFSWQFTLFRVHHSKQHFLTYAIKDHKQPVYST